MTVPSIPFRLETLSNGLRVVLIPQPALHRAHAALYVRVGSRFESKETNGLSHFLEHMLYRGTQSMPSAHRVNLAFERLGATLMASTQVDSGILSFTLPPESLDEALAHFAEVVAEPLFLDIDVERGIVCEEILEDLDDEGRQVDADNLSRDLIYAEHPLGFTITGSAERVRAFSLNDLRSHHRRHYGALSSVLAISGNIHVERTLEQVERRFRHLLPGDSVVAVPPLHTQTKARLRMVENVSSQTELRVCFRAIPYGSLDQDTLELAMRILDDGMSTRLYHRLCDDQGLCYNVSGGFDGYEDDGIVDFAASVQHARASRVVTEIFSMLRELSDKGPELDEVDKARRRASWELRGLLDSPEDVAAYFAEGILFHRLVPPDARAENLTRVSAEEIRELLSRITAPSRLNVVGVGMLRGDEGKRLREIVRSYGANTEI